jgi:hypothetical protein
MGVGGKEFVSIRIPGSVCVFVKTGLVFDFCKMCGICLLKPGCFYNLPPRWAIYLSHGRLGYIADYKIYNFKVYNNKVCT